MYLRARENTSVYMVKVEGGRKGWRIKGENFMEKMVRCMLCNRMKYLWTFTSQRNMTVHFHIRNMGTQ